MRASMEDMLSEASVDVVFNGHVHACLLLPLSLAKTLAFLCTGRVLNDVGELVRIQSWRYRL